MGERERRKGKEGGAGGKWEGKGREGKEGREGNAPAPKYFWPGAARAAAPAIGCCGDIVLSNCITPGHTRDHAVNPHLSPSSQNVPHVPTDTSTPP